MLVILLETMHQPRIKLQPAVNLVPQHSIVTILVCKKKSLNSSNLPRQLLLFIFQEKENQQILLWCLLGHLHARELILQLKRN